MERASRAIESRPRTTKTALARLISGKRQDVLAAIGRLCAEGYVQTTPGERAPVLTSVRPYRHDRGQSGSRNGEAMTGEPVTNRFSGVGEEPVGNHGASRETTALDAAKDRLLPHKTAYGSEPAPRCEPRCRVCSDASIRQLVNRQLVEGYSLSAILAGLAALNSGLAPNRRVTKDSLETHRERHWPAQAGANALWRRLMEERAATEAANYEQAVTSLLTPRVYLEVMMTKGFAGLTNEAAEVSIDQGLAAARELGKLADRDDDEQRWAKVYSQQAKIVDAFRLLPAEWQQVVLDKVEGRTPPAPGSAPRLALVEATVDDDELDPFDDEGDEDFDDD